MINNANKVSHYVVYEKDLPFYCPPNNSNISHPRVFLDLKHKLSALCPYCSMHYVLKK